MVAGESFEEFATSAEPMLFRAAWALTRNRHTSEDLVQETLARIFARWRRLATIDNTHGYARTTLVRLHISAQRRKSSSEISSELVDQTVSGPDVATTISVQRAMAQLSATDRAVLILRFQLDLPVTDVAATLDLTEQAVRSRTSRAAARLRERLGADFRVLT